MVDGRVSFTGSGPGFVLDERSGFLYFTATEKDPRERHLYRVRLDGTGRTRLTREDGTHSTVVSPDGRFYADTWSDVQTPPRAWLTSQDGTRRFTLEANADPEILKYERGSLEWVELKAADGTTLYGSLLKPADFDPARRYPVIVSVYGGPHAQTVTNAWEHVSPRDSLLASRGFLVFKLDNRGMAARGTAFEFPLHRDMGRVELQDQLTGVEHLKSLPFVDPGRIGITGWSYGGYLTLYALTNAPSVFKAGVAGAPVTDWKHYDSIYTERYMGTPREQPEGLRDQLAAPEGRSARGRPAADPRGLGRQRAPRQHDGVRRGAGEGRQALLAAGPPAASSTASARRKTGSPATGRSSPTSSGRCAQARTRAPRRPTRPRAPLPRR